MLRPRLLFACCSLIVVAGCAAQQPARTSEMPPADEPTRQACWAEAERKFQSIPAISTGRTSYLQTDERTRLYQECLARRGRR